MNINSSVPRKLVTLSALLSFVFVLLSDIIPSPFGGYADQRFLQVILSGLLVASALVFLGCQRKISPARLVGTLIVTLALSLAFLLLSLPFVQLRPYVWVEPGMYTFFFMAVIMAAAVLTWSGQLASYVRFLAVLIAGGCFLYGAMSINVYLFATFDGVTDLTDFIPWGFVNIRYWSHIATWLLPLVPLAVLVSSLKEYRLWRVVVALGAGLWWWIIFLSSARGSALGIAFGITLAALLLGRKAIPWLKYSVFYFSLGIVMWLMLAVAIPSLISDEITLRMIKTDSSGRLPMFIEAWRMSLQDFPFGMGPQSWLTHEVLTGTYAESKRFGHPHNMYLMWAAEYGWVLIGFLGLVVGQAVRYFWWRRAAVRTHSSDEQALVLAGFTASVSAALFHAGVSAVFMAPGSMLVGLFILIGFWACIIPESIDVDANKDLGRLSFSRKVILLALVSAVLLLWLAWAREVWVYYCDMRQDEVTYHERVGEGTLPRFWFHGNFPR